MDLTPEILLPDQVWFQIFKYIDLKTLMKLRNVNVELMNLIEKFGGWKTLFFDSSTLAPWRNQLCGMYDPKLTRDEYDSQPDGFYKKLIALYISWKSLGSAKELQKVYVHSNKNFESHTIWRHDLCGHLLAYITESDVLYILNVNTLKLVAEPCKFLESAANKTTVKSIKIWQPHLSEDETYLLERKLFIIVQMYESMFMWDVDEKVSVPVPEIIQEIYHDLESHVSWEQIYRCENDIFVYVTDTLKFNFTIIKLAWNQIEKKITGRIIFQTSNPRHLHTSCGLFDMYTENQKLIFVFRHDKKIYFTQTDIPKVNEPPRFMNLIDNLAEFKQIFPDYRDELIDDNVRINNSYVVTAFYDDVFYVALKKETQDGEYDFVSKSIRRFDRRFQISDCVFMFDVLFILTKESHLRVYTFKNSNHLMDVDLFTDKAEVLVTRIGSNPKIKLMTRKNCPHALLVSWLLHFMMIEL